MSLGVTTLDGPLETVSPAEVLALGTSADSDELYCGTSDGSAGKLAAGTHASVMGAGTDAGIQDALWQWGPLCWVLQQTAMNCTVVHQTALPSNWLQVHMLQSWVLEQTLGIQNALWQWGLLCPLLR